jgi:hypothetical protein
MPGERGDVVAPLAARLRREIGRADVLTDRPELRTCECDGLAVCTVVPALVPLPETRDQGRVVALAHTAEIPDASIRGAPS